ncbi:ATP-binding cassette domain-containing protein [Breznakia pachnodae]|uniref:ABC-2 type transport system ATP-binding protein n=1 Tax=Breznakia pachnodae TaxID=265178 RepID=A0ABU0E2Y6_9FIRM|nr:ABC transporter ATP-binding protein [Breznakia pachnodae]MDQ0361196.1 ABC-2 type transport system ATP-binding protein [Breznakia pachnodae]
MKLTVKDLSMEFEQKVVLKGINYTFESGKIYALLGRNGAGKTTLFNCIASDLQATTMEIELDDGVNVRNQLLQEDVGYVISTPVVPDFLTGREFLRFVLDIHKIDYTKEELDGYFDYLIIDEADRDILMKNYSHGMKNKMQMLVNIITKPSILLLDEPLTSFDVVMAEQMKQMLRDIKKDRILIFSTHIMELALDLCDEVLVLHDGYIQEVNMEDLSKDDVKTKVIEMLSEETL